MQLQKENYASGRKELLRICFCMLLRYVRDSRGAMWKHPAPFQIFGAFSGPVSSILELFLEMVFVRDGVFCRRAGSLLIVCRVLSVFVCTANRTTSKTQAAYILYYSCQTPSGFRLAIEIEHVRTSVSELNTSCFVLDVNCKKNVTLRADGSLIAFSVYCRGFTSSEGASRYCRERQRCNMPESKIEKLLISFPK